VALKLLAIDTITGVFKKTSVDPAAIASFSDDEFDVGMGGQTDFVLTNGTVQSGNKIDVHWNGQLIRSSNFTRNTGLNKIIFSTPFPEGAWIHVRSYT